jgi:hypothetical protein
MIQWDYEKGFCSGRYENAKDELGFSRIFFLTMVLKQLHARQWVAMATHWLEGKGDLVEASMVSIKF